MRAVASLAAAAIAVPGPIQARKSDQNRLASIETASGISIRSRFAEILSAFPNLQRDEVLTDSLNEGRSEKEFEILVAMTRGIAFELRSGAAADPNAGGYCAAIHVFRPGTEPRVMDAFDQG